MVETTYEFRRVTPLDLALLRSWRQQPHVIEYWGQPDVEDAATSLADPRIAMWIVSLIVDGSAPRPFAYAQDYCPHDWANHPFAYLPPGARGIDQYIGDAALLGAGHGSAFVRRHCDRLIGDGAPVIGTDPHPDNLRARRAYEKAGFVTSSGPVDTRWGRAILMERWP